MSDWQSSQRYPDPSIRVVDESFARYRLNLAKVERLADYEGKAVRMLSE